MSPPGTPPHCGSYRLPCRSCKPRILSSMTYLRSSLSAPSFHLHSSFHSLRSPLLFALLIFLLCAVIPSPASALVIVDPPEMQGTIMHVSAAFGPPAWESNITAPLLLADPLDGCSPIKTPHSKGAVLLIYRGECAFLDKVLAAQQAGAAGVVVGNNVDEPALATMAAGDDFNQSTISIPSVLISQKQYLQLKHALLNGQPIVVCIDERGEVVMEHWTAVVLVGLIVTALPLICLVSFALATCVRSVSARIRASERMRRAREFPVVQYGDTLDNTESERNSAAHIVSVSPPDTDRPHSRQRQQAVHNTGCSVCLEDFQRDTTVCVLPCRHAFHPQCVKPWLERSELCPVCKQPVLDETEGGLGSAVMSMCRRSCCCCFQRSQGMIRLDSL